MKQAYFITGTDTDIGKTYVTVNLLKYFNQQGLKTAALKPIASGCEQTAEGLRNDDAQQLQAAMSMDFPYHQTNPIAFEPPIAPHIAAEQIGKRLSVKETLNACQPILNSHYDRLLIEGLGGWQVPLNDTETTADLANAFGFPIILVVGVRLGCLNHSLLTWENIKTQQTPIAGWIANRIDPDMLYPKENIATLTKRFQTPPITILEYQSKNPQFAL